ncbi:MAG: Uma2 family endonuclease [Polaromonas sp.]|nr:Uma2 family endonuclease [Polaromonas sp.]
MSYALLKPLTEVDYLAEEERAKTKHEFVDGTIHAMAGASERHNTIAGNLFVACHAARGGSACRPFMGDMRLRLEGGNVYYYPDVMVVCNLEDTDPMFKSLPCLLAEVTSPSTDGIDRREKMSAYLKIPTLREYLIISQDSPVVDLYQRHDMNQWHTTQLGTDDSFTSVCLAMTLSVKTLYATLDF